MNPNPTIEVKEYRRIFEQLRGTETAKDQLVEQLLKHIESLNNRFEIQNYDYEQEMEYNRRGQLVEKQLREDIRMLHHQMDRDPFVLVLIDGDGTLFKEDLVQKGEAGGKEAGAMLSAAIQSYIQRELPDLPLDCKIIARIYSNSAGLSQAYANAGLLDVASVYCSFAKGFTRSKQLFDHVDVGSGKDRADEKITELFKMYYNNVHCRHIIFGCSHDNGYARLLEEFAGGNPNPKVTLLEGVPFERELRILMPQFRHAKFEMFRTEKIENKNFITSGAGIVNGASAANGKISQPPTTATFPSLPIKPAGSPPQANGTLSRTASSDSHAQLAVAASASVGYRSPYQPDLIPPAPSKSANGSPSMGTSWAAAASLAPPPLSTASPAATIRAEPKAQIVPRNKHGQRVDEVKETDSSEYHRVKNLKLCSTHFLREECFRDKCDFNHNYKPSKAELDVLKQVTRTTPCNHGSECDDFKCVYGHRCPYGTPGSRTCKYRDRGICRFSEAMHGIDEKVVRTVKIS